MILKTIEFHTAKGQRVKITDIPVLEEDNPFHFSVQIRLQILVNKVYNQGNGKETHSFRNYLKKVLKWPDYEKLFKINELKNNA
ncbi:hypothetical protein J2S13_000829 [Oikeobacillus pervagus]|uniref:DUF2535 family protein n=1 Tax=Oikeobacillus pervagus TaxID=1325931 RepID=A0AAJ1SX65_9BACI|nr:DUF2535 family protein [Oikeobacillus pervagus]MDQ0214433.1 hypothetical protein [Oikeobacillus pervagus]